MPTNFAVALTKDLCPACGKAHDGAIVMNTRLYESAARKVEALHGQAIAYRMCSACQEALDQGAVFLIEIDPARSRLSDDGARVRPEDAFRTGRAWGVKRDAVQRIFGAACDLQFIDPEVAEYLGLPDPSAT